MRAAPPNPTGSGLDRLTLPVVVFESDPLLFVVVAETGEPEEEEEEAGEVIERALWLLLLVLLVYEVGDDEIAPPTGFPSRST